MKKSILGICVFIILSITSYGQFNFNVSPALGVSGAYIGYKIGNVVPFVGIQFISGSSTIKSHYMEYNETTQTYVPVDRTEEISGSVYMPYLGAKLFFDIDKSSKLKPYISAMFFKPFFSTEYTDDTEIIMDDEDLFDNLNIYGFEAGFGTEFFLDESFSLGGEAGIRMIFGATDYSETDFYSDEFGNTIEYERLYDYSTLIGMSYAKINFNFYIDL